MLTWPKASTYVCQSQVYSESVLYASIFLSYLEAYFGDSEVRSTNKTRTMMLLYSFHNYVVYKTHYHYNTFQFLSKIDVYIVRLSQIVNIRQWFHKLRLNQSLPFFYILLHSYYNFYLLVLGPSSARPRFDCDYNMLWKQCCCWLVNYKFYVQLHDFSVAL